MGSFSEGMMFKLVPKRDYCLSADVDSSLRWSKKEVEMGNSSREKRRGTPGRSPGSSKEFPPVVVAAWWWPSLLQGCNDGHENQGSSALPKWNGYLVKGLYYLNAAFSTLFSPFQLKQIAFRVGTTNFHLVSLAFL